MPDYSEYTTEKIWDILDAAYSDYYKICFPSSISSRRWHSAWHSFGAKFGGIFRHIAAFDGFHGGFIPL